MLKAHLDRSILSVAVTAAIRLAFGVLLAVLLYQYGDYGLLLAMVVLYAAVDAVTDVVGVIAIKRLRVTAQQLRDSWRTP